MNRKLLFGLGVIGVIAGDLRTCAEQGNAFAQSNLGLMYDNGRGVPEDDAEAVRWYRLAAESDSCISTAGSA